MESLIFLWAMNYIETACEDGVSSLTMNPNVVSARLSCSFSRPRELPEFLSPCRLPYQVRKNDADKKIPAVDTMTGPLRYDIHI